jgi:hypothetical protein
MFSSMMLYTHLSNFTAYRTTNERFSRKKRRPRNEDSTNMTDASILTYSDIYNNDEELAAKKRTRRNKAGCCKNFFKMATHTRIVPQEKLYDFLADRSVELDEDDLKFI